MSEWRTALVWRQIDTEVAELGAPLTFFDSLTGDELTVPAGFRSDGTTRPRRPWVLRVIFWRLIGHPFTPALLSASFLHDHEISLKAHPWFVVHSRYFRALRARDAEDPDRPRVSAVRAAVMTAALLAAGPRW